MSFFGGHSVNMLQFCLRNVSMHASGLIFWNGKMIRQCCLSLYAAITRDVVAILDLGNAFGNLDPDTVGVCWG